MGSTLDRKKMVPEGGNNRYGFILVFIFMVWLFWPNNNSFIRLSYWSYNVFYNASKLINHPMSSESMYYRNCAIYLAKIYPAKSEPALKSMQKAIIISSNKKVAMEIEKFYRERAIINLYYGKKHEALEDYEKAGILEDPVDNLRAAMLLIDENRPADAIRYCKGILVNGKDKSPIAYVCYAYVYEKNGKAEEALDIYNWILSRKTKDYYLYVERANLEKRMGDMPAYNKDISTVKKLEPNIDIEKISLTDNALNFKTIPLSVK